VETEKLSHRSTNTAFDSEAPFNAAFNPPNGIFSPSPASTEESVKTPKKSKVLVDYKANDFRGFIFVVHSSYGLMLLQCTRKKNKPLHWQLPGGHIDDPEFEEAARRVVIRKPNSIAENRSARERRNIDVRKKFDRLPAFRTAFAWCQLAKRVQRSSFYHLR
jgi:hypothetical protein